MAEDHVVAVGEPAQQLTGLLAGLAVELAWVGDEFVGQPADARVHRGCVVHGVLDVGEDPPKFGRQLLMLRRLETVDLDVHPRLDDRALWDVGVVVDVEDLGEAPGIIARYDQLRVQDPLDGISAAFELGADGVDQVRRVAGDDGDSRRIGVDVPHAQQDLPSGTHPAEGEIVAGEGRQRAAVAAGQLPDRVHKVSLSEDVGVDATGDLGLRTRAGVGHLLATSL